MATRTGLIQISCFALAAVLAAGCTYKHKLPNTIYMPDMVYSPAIKAQKLGSMMPPPKGTIPRGDYVPYKFASNPDEAGRVLHNPLPRTMAVLKRGQVMYNIYCIVCHGPNGEGDGTVVPKFPRPPSLQSDKVRGWPDGRIYNNIRIGQNLMPSYASQIQESDRWAIIHYIRALQRAKHPTKEDLKAYEEESK